MNLNRSQQTIQKQFQILFETILYRKLFHNTDPSPELMRKIFSQYNISQMRLINYYQQDLGDDVENLGVMLDELYGPSYTGLTKVYDEKESELERDQVVESLRPKIQDYLYSNRDLYGVSPEQQFERLQPVSIPISRNNIQFKKRKAKSKQKR